MPMSIRRLCRLALVAVVLGLGAGAAVAAGPPAPAVTLSMAGDEEMVFRHERDACDPLMLPDSPARAFRDFDGMVHLFATHYLNWAMVGRSLDAARVDCRSVLRAPEDPRVERYDDRAWLQAFFTTDGRAIEALISHDFNGQRHPGGCKVVKPRPVDCWYGAITAARSEDGGYSFHQSPAPARVVAEIPYRYDPTAARPRGFLTASNIVSRDGAAYALLYVEAEGPQRRGNCLVRTTEPATPSSWRAWDGAGFDVAFADPHATPTLTPERHICPPVGAGILDWPVRSLGWYAPARVYVAVLFASQRDAATGAAVPGVYYATSPDLIQWSRLARLLAAKQQLDPVACQSYIRYPSLLDPSSPSRLFETLGGEDYLYYTRFNLHDCHQTLDRDLVRRRVSLRPAG